jgi:hypothetical protein
MAMQYLPDGGNWTLTGSTSYQNPIQVTVQEGTISADIYEPNNTLAQSYNFPLSFSGNAASANSNGSNCNTGTDYDFYKINLDPGYSYGIGAVVNDAGYGGGQTYTLDAIWGYSTDGSTWSATFDDVDPNSIVMANGGTVYFEVAPKFTGTTGTYKLVLNITKNPLGIGESGQNAYKVYPNPASDYIYLAPSSQHQQPSNVRILTVDGREMKNIEPGKHDDIMKIGTSDLQNGLYILQIFLPEGIVTKQVVIRK